MADQTSLPHPKPPSCTVCKKDVVHMFDSSCPRCFLMATEQILELESKLEFLRILAAGEENPTDITLVCSDGHTVGAHMSVLVSRSPVFKAMLNSGKTQTRSVHIDPSSEVIGHFVKFLYTAEANLDGHMAHELFILGERYQVEHLKQQCQKYLLQNLKLEDVMSEYEFAGKHGANLLRNAAIRMMKSSMGGFLKEEGYVRRKEDDPEVLIQLYKKYLGKHDTAGDNIE